MVAVLPIRIFNWGLAPMLMGSRQKLIEHEAGSSGFVGWFDCGKYLKSSFQEPKAALLDAVLLLSLTSSLKC